MASLLWVDGGGPKQLSLFADALPAVHLLLFDAQGDPLFGSLSPSHTHTRARYGESESLTFPFKFVPLLNKKKK